MEQIARCLGVELDEPFCLSDQPAHIRHCFTKDGLAYLDDSQPVVKLKPVLSVRIINDILTGRSEIIKIPFKPRHHEVYWTYEGKNWRVENTPWLMYARDYARLSAGMVFRSQDQAIQNRPAVYEKLTGKKWDD